MENLIEDPNYERYDEAKEQLNKCLPEYNNYKFSFYFTVALEIISECLSIFKYCYIARTN